MRMQTGDRLDATQPFSRADARATSIPLAEVLSHRYRRLFHDVYLASSVVITLPIRAGAAVRVNGPSAFASHVTAAALWGGSVPQTAVIHVSVGQGSPRSERAGIVAHRGGPERPRRSVSGVRLSDPLECFLECASLGLDFVDLVVLGDSLVRRGLFSPAHLVAVSATWVGSGVKVARRAARYVRSDVDSPMETRLRLLIVLAGLPEPEVNVVIRDADGEWVFRFDLAYPGLKVIIEYDGRHHAESTKQWRRDIERREALDQLGWRLIVVESTGIYAEPEVTLSRIRTILIERGMTVPRRIRPEWTRVFLGGLDSTVGRTGTDTTTSSGQLRAVV